MAKKNFLSDTYLVKTGSPVKLTITVGYGQSGVTSADLSRQAVVSRQAGDIIGQELGNGESLDGQTLHCSTWVTDIQPGTNQTSVTYRLTGGVSDYQHTLETTVSENDSVSYLAVIDFELA